VVSEAFWLFPLLTTGPANAMPWMFVDFPALTDWAGRRSAKNSNGGGSNRDAGKQGGPDDCAEIVHSSSD